MKQSEKDELLETINEFSTEVSFRGKILSEPIIEVSKLKIMIDGIPIDKEEINEIYAIKDFNTGEMIWNAHGCPYKNKEDVEKKIKKLRCLLQNRDKFYQIITYKRED